MFLLGLFVNISNREIRFFFDSSFEGGIEGIFEGGIEGGIEEIFKEKLE
jgi:hypothetical protein